MFVFTNNGGRKNLNHLREDVTYWHRPAGAIIEIVNYIKDNNKLDYSSLQNNYKELLIGSLFLSVLEKTQKEKFYISKTKENPPDFVFMFLKKDERDRLWFSSREVEIVRNVNSIEELEDTILLKDKNYSKDITILCYVETPGITDLRLLSSSICSKLKNISDVLVLFHGVMLDHIQGNLDNKVSLVQVSPEYIVYSGEINMNEIIENFKIEPEKLIYVKEGVAYYGKRSETEEYPKIIK
jgi:hypothetical protein